ncbi:MAG: hypothetical protein JNM78_13485 [Cyclobacteriaceae bacterium]|nr:hypothetical protein [Cyclobacteriaceae bacterium]
MKRGYLFFILLVCLIGCSNEDPISTDVGLNYFPLQTGDSWIYTVEETTINQTVTASTAYELSVTVTDSVKNSDGKYTYTFHRAKRMTESDSWESFGTWTAMVSRNQLIQREGNILFVKLIFPLSDGLTWNGNQFNNLPNMGNLFTGKGSEVYHTSEYDQSKNLTTTLEFDKTITIIHNEFVDPIVGKDVRKEVYARDVGLIYKEVTQLEYCSVGNCLGQQKVDKGVIMIQTLKSYASK